MPAVGRAARMDPFEEGLSAMDRFCLSNSTNDQRSTSTQSESSGGLERLLSSAGPDKRRRHIVRSGGTKGTEIITCYQEPKTTATPSLAGKRAWTDAASQHNQTEETLAQAAVERLSERCSQILHIHAEAKHRKAQNIIHANELPYASPEYLLEFVRQATLQFLDDKAKIEAARRPVIPSASSLSSLSMQPSGVESLPQYNRPEFSFPPNQHYVSQDRRIRQCQRVEEPYMPEQLWKDALVEEAWNCQSLQAFPGPMDDFLPKLEPGQQLPWN